MRNTCQAVALPGCFINWASTPGLYNDALHVRHYASSECAQPIDIIEIEPLQHQLFHACLRIGLDLPDNHIWCAGNGRPGDLHAFNDSFERFSGKFWIVMTPTETTIQLCHVASKVECMHHGTPDVSRIASRFLYQII